MMGTLLLFIVFAPIFSVWWDAFTYTDRQDKWEKAHPGATYIRGYRKFEKQSRKARRLGGEV